MCTCVCPLSNGASFVYVMVMQPAACLFLQHFYITCTVTLLSIIWGNNDQTTKFVFSAPDA